MGLSIAGLFKYQLLTLDWVLVTIKKLIKRLTTQAIVVELLDKKKLECYEC